MCLIVMGNSGRECIAFSPNLLSPLWNKLGNIVCKDVNGLMYAQMINTIAVPEVQQLYTIMSVWQDKAA